MNTEEIYQKLYQNCEQGKKQSDQTILNECWWYVVGENKLLEKNCLYICFADSNIGVGHLFRSQILAKSLKNMDGPIFYLVQI